MAINTSNKCSTCGGTVRNADGKRLTIERLTERHDHTCPGIRRAQTRGSKTND